MSVPERYEIGSSVRCADGDCGELEYVVVNPVTERLAHLIVAARGLVSRLVPVEKARVEEDGIVLDCTLDEFEGLEPAIRTHFLTDDDGATHYGYPSEQVMYWPYFGLGPARTPLGLAAPEPVMTPQMEVEDRVPAGEVRVRRGEKVHAADGRIGRVRGLVVDAADDAVTHVLLDEGHLWGRKQVAIPIGAVGEISGEEVSVRLSKQEIKDLPPVEVLGLD